MTVISRVPPPAAHLFPARSVGLNMLDGAYFIVKRLPERDGEFEYQ
jgi:hypothetical protein